MRVRFFKASEDLRDKRFVAGPWGAGCDPVHPWNHTGPLLLEWPGTGWRC